MTFWKLLFLSNFQKSKAKKTQLKKRSDFVRREKSPKKIEGVSEGIKIQPD